MQYVIDKAQRPAYLQLYQLLRDDVIRGTFPCGSKLPSKRLLSAELGLSTVTIEHAYGLLCDEGYAESRERSGYFVIFRPSDGFAAPALGAEAAKASPLPVRRIPASDPEFSLSILSKTMRKVLADFQDALLERPPNSGCIELRSAIARYLARNRSIRVSLDQIVVGSGAEYLYGQIVTLLGREKVYAIESPSYEKIEQIYHAAGVRCELLPLAQDGIDSAALSACRADVLHTTPYRSFPSGVTASASKRHEYLRWAEHSGRFLVESDYGSEFSVSSQPMETLFVLSKGDNVIYLNTFSRTISPALRVGYMVLPEQLVQPYVQKLGFLSCTVPAFEQLVLAELLNSGDFERHINRVRRARRRALSGQS